MDSRLYACAAARVCAAQLTGGVCMCMLRAGSLESVAPAPIATAELDGLGAE